jgi:type III secretion protein J
MMCARAPWIRSLKALLAILAVALSACSGKVELMAAVPEEEANEVLAALLNAGIAADKVPGKDGMVGLRVEQAHVAQAVGTLGALGLPRERFAGMGDVFRKEGLISSPVEERARYLFALSQELSNTLSHIDGVLVARVHLVLPERSTSGEPSLPSSAAVFLKVQPDSNVGDVQPQIRRLVVNSIPGLTTEKVSVVMVPSATRPKSSETALADVLWFRVEALSANGLAATLVALAMVAVAGLGVSGYLGWRHVLAPRWHGAASES